MTEKLLIAGLGNPGAKYQDTRHNVGFRVIDELVGRYSLGAGRADQGARTWDGAIEGARVKLAQPQTYMNRSGQSIRSLLDYYDISLENLLVVHDDLDTPFGMLRLRQAGGHGGQNGLRSIVQHLGSKDFARLRFGIGRPPGKMDPVDYVLQRFKGDDEILARELAGRAAAAVTVWLSQGIEQAMSQFNGEAGSKRVRPSRSELEAQLALTQRARELAPSDPKPLTKLIALQKKLGMLDEAVGNHLALARLFDALEQPRLANSERVKAVTIKPDLVDAQAKIAHWFLSQGNNKKAVARILILAQHQSAQGDTARARSAIKRALAINPQHPKALQMQAALAEATGTE